jgi:hypothetical protein
VAAANARQWQSVSLYGFLNHGSSMSFEGSLAQYQACLDLGNPCTGVDNTADEAWSQLHSELNYRDHTAARGE